MTRRRPVDWADWEERQRTCRRKQPYNSIKVARAILEKLRSRETDDPSTLGVYECRFCRQYHIGHRRGGTWESEFVDETNPNPRKGDVR